MVVVGAPHRAAEQETPVAAAEVQHHRRPPPEQRRPVERPLRRQPLQRGLRPPRRLEDLTRDGDAELPLDAPWLAHAGIVLARRPPPSPGFRATFAGATDGYGRERA